MTPPRRHLRASLMRGATLCLVLAFFSPVVAWGGPLLYAAGKGDINEMVRLLAAGADPNKQWDLGASHDGVTAQYWAALNGRVESIRLLNRPGLDPNIQNLAARTGGPPVPKARLRA